MVVSTAEDIVVPFVCLSADLISSVLNAVFVVVVIVAALFCFVVILFSA